MAAADHASQILETLQALRQYALRKAARGLEIGLRYHEEDSRLVRFANSAISLNTSEHLIRLEIVAYQGNRRASYDLITGLEQRAEMQAGVEHAIELVQHAQPLAYQPSVPVYTQSFRDESAFDPALAQISNAERLDFFNQVVAGLESDQVLASGVFSNGETLRAMLYTTSEHSQLFRHSDAQVIAVLAHVDLKWEALTEGSAQRVTDLDASRLRQELQTLVEGYQRIPPEQLPLGRYDIVFGRSAIADMLTFMRLIGFHGGNMKRDSSFLSLAQIGKIMLSGHFSLSDDPSQRETYPFRRDFTGLPRGRFPIFERGVFQGFTWAQDDADEYGVQPSGHTVDHLSLAVAPGEQAGAADLEQLFALPRERDLLYIPYLHYLNIVNPTKGVITASSRFGARLLRRDGSLGVPYNVRMTQSLLDVFGERVAWLSSQVVAHNTSQSYERRNPTAIIVPAFMRVNDLEISHTNNAY